VGAYDIRRQNGDTYPAVSRAVSFFSSHGPTSDGRAKPDIIAPGRFVYSSINSFDVVTEDYSAVDIKPEPDGTHSYAMMQGTSMATPMVTGLVALMLEANPALTPDTLAALLRKYATIDDAIRDKDKNVRGAGKANALATFANINDRADLPLSIRSVFSHNDDATPLFTIVPNPNKGTFHLRFDDAGQGEMLVYNLIGTLLQRQTVTSNQALSLQHLPTGIYIIRLQLGKQLSAQKMVIW
jgi:subtilisin family serine protease